MTHWYEDKKHPTWTETSASTGPALIGAATGILLGNMIHKGARTPLALSLLAVGAALIAPSTVQTVIEKINSPSTNRGSNRTLRQIREGSGAPAKDIDYVKEEVDLFL